jgi:hypothetical protein
MPLARAGIVIVMAVEVSRAGAATAAGPPVRFESASRVSSGSVEGLSLLRILMGAHPRRDRFVTSTVA